MNSTILLCCIKPNKNRPYFTAEVFLSFLSKFGKILKIIIFSRKIITKLFTELESENPPKNYVNSISEVECPFGKLQVFNSDKTKIETEFQDKNDYWYCESLINEKLNFSNEKLNEGQVNNFQKSCSHPSGTDENIHSGFYKMIHDPRKKSFYVPEKNSFDFETVNKKNEFDGPIKSSTKQNKNVFPLNDLPNENSFIIQISNFKPKVMKFQWLINLFSIGTEVVEGYFSKRFKICLLSFKDLKSCQKAIDEFRNVFLFGDYLRFQLFVNTKFNSLLLSYPIKPQDWVIYYKKKKTKFTQPNSSGNIPLLSKTYLIQNLPPAISLNLLRVFLLEKQDSKSLKEIIKISNTSFLVKWNNLTSSVETLISLQGIQIDNKKVKISFVNDL